MPVFRHNCLMFPKKLKGKTALKWINPKNGTEEDIRGVL